MAIVMKKRVMFALQQTPKGAVAQSMDMEGKVCRSRACIVLAKFKDRGPEIVEVSALLNDHKLEWLCAIDNHDGEQIVRQTLGENEVATSEHDDRLEWVV